MSQQPSPGDPNCSFHALRESRCDDYTAFQAVIRIDGDDRSRPHSKEYAKNKRGKDHGRDKD